MSKVWREMPLATKEPDAWQQGYTACQVQGEKGDPRAPYDGRSTKAKAWYAGWKAAAEQAGKGAA